MVIIRSANPQWQLRSPCQASRAHLLPNNLLCSPCFTSVPSLHTLIACYFFATVTLVFSLPSCSCPVASPLWPTKGHHQALPTKMLLSSLAHYINFKMTVIIITGIYGMLTLPQTLYWFVVSLTILILKANLKK